MTYAWFVLFQRCASHRTMHMSYRSKTDTWNDVILVKRSMIRGFFIVSHLSCLVTWYACGQLNFNCRIANYTWPDTRTMVLLNSRSIQKHRTGCEFSYCDRREAGCAFAWRSHVTKSCLSWDISDVTSCNALRSRFGTYLTSRRVTLWRHVFTSRPPALRHIHVKNVFMWEYKF